MPAYTFGIALYDKDTGNIEYSLFIENGKRYPASINNIKNKNNWAAWCILNKQELLINDVETEYKHYLQDRKITYGLKMNSLIYCPLIFEANVLGVITVQSTDKNAYSQYNLDTVKALASYIAIAIRNAQKSNDLEKLNGKLLALSNLDGLTQIPNRRYFDQEIDRKWISGKFNNEPISLMILDVDSFKEYNDNYGHLAGDLCLQQIAKVLYLVSSENNGFAARYGGDEFVLVFQGKTSSEAVNLAEIIQHKITALNIEHKFSKVVNYITLTFGICTLVPSENLEAFHLMAYADKALYSAKQKGRNRIEAY